MREPAVRSFAELALLRHRLRALHEQELARLNAEREARERSWAEQHLFESTVGAVVPLRN